MEVVWWAGVQRKLRLCVTDKAFARAWETVGDAVQGYLQDENILMLAYGRRG
jgi:hypothetical protein